MNVVVTGGSGFIGSHVVDALVDAGHRVTVIDHRVRPHRSDVEFEDVDLLDLSSVLAATREAEHIFHLAAVSNVNYAYKYPAYSTALNVMGTTNVLEAARVNGAKRVHLASTVWVYNGSPDDEQEVDETVPFYLNGAGHIYTSTKMACEMLCHNYGELYDLPFTVLRYGIPYGPRMREELLIPIFLKKALNGESLTVAGDGSQYRKFVYVTDIARAHLLAMDESAARQTYNLEGPERVTVLQVAERIRDLIGDHVKIERAVLRRPMVLSGILLGASEFAAIGAVDTVWARLLTDRGASTTFIGVSLTMMVLPLAVLAPAGGRLSDRRDPRVVGLVGSEVILPVFALYGWLVAPIAIAVAGAVHSVLMAAVNPAAATAVARGSPPEFIARGQGMLDALGFIFSAIAAVVMGFTYDLYGPGISATTMAIAIGGLVFAAYWVSRKELGTAPPAAD